jgi:hypothetical protein
LAAEDVSQNSRATRGLWIFQITRQVIEDAAVMVLGDSLMQAFGLLRLRRVACQCR